MSDYVRANMHLYQLLCANCHRIKTEEDRLRDWAPPVEADPVAAAERARLRSEHGRIAAGKRWESRSPEVRSAIAKRAVSARPKQKAAEALADQGLRKCGRCEQVKALDQFTDQAARRASYCRACNAAYMARWRQTH